MLIPSIQSRRPWLLVVFVIVIGLELYFNFSFKGGLQERTRLIDRFFGSITLPMEYLIAEIKTGAANSIRYSADLLNAKSENLKLKAQIQDQKMSLHFLEELRLENERLRSLLGFKEAQPLSYKPAKIIGKDPGIFFRTVIIDRGSQDGISEKMPVVSSRGLVGYVLQTSFWSSKVLLITDLNSSVDAVVQRSRTRAIVGGDIDGSLNLRFLPRRQDVKAGDVLVTSGLGGVFPSGFQIGKISRVKKNPNEVLDEVDVDPAVDFDSLEEVLIVTDLSKVRD